MAKRAFDLVLSVIALMVLSPLMVAAAIVVRVSMGSPILYRPVRPGRAGEPFEIYKFRTMRTGEGNDADRLTPVGRILRSLSIDELPQFVNVLKGDMSLVGPRPLPMAYLERYTDHQARRHEVRPGITGLAQVNGRNNVDWDARFDHDVHYVDNHTLILDLRIIIDTVQVVLGRKGVSAEGHATMPEFFAAEGDDAVKSD